MSEKKLEQIISSLYRGPKLGENHTGTIRIAGYKDIWVAMTHPKAAKGTNPVIPTMIRQI